MKIALILGTTREGANSRKVAEYVLEKLKTRKNIGVTFVDPVDFKLDYKNEGAYDVSGFINTVSESDGFFIVSPEYNHSFPGTLKLLIDQAYKQYQNKAVAVCGVSNGPWGGSRMIELLIPVLKCVGLKQTQKDTRVPFADTFPGDLPKDFDKQLEAQIDELLWLTEALKKGRESV